MAAFSEHPDSQPKPALPRERRVLATLYHISSLVGQIDEPAGAMARIIDELAAFFGADAAMLALVNPDTSTLEVELSRGFPEDHHKAAIPPGVGLVGWVALHNRAVVVGDVALDSRYVRLRPGTRATMAAPLELDGHLQGVLALEDDTAHAFNETDQQTFVLLVGEAASVLRRLWLINHLRRKASQLEVLSAIAGELAGKLQPEELLDTVTRESHRIMHCRLVVLQLYDTAHRQVRLQAIFPAGDCFESPEREWALEDSLAGSAISTRKQVEFANVGLPEFIDLRDVPNRAGVVSMLITPLIADNEVLGVLSVGTEHLHRFSNDERRVLAALANLAAVALQNARLYQRAFESEEGMRQSERLTTLGLLAAEIAHETRNPLTVIRLLFGALDLQFPADDPRSTDVAIIREKLDQLESFVTRVLSFAKAPETLHARWQVDDLIRETCLLMRLKLTQARIHLHYEPAEAPLIVDCNKGQLQQVLLNVILNATHAMPDGGTIAITCRPQQGAIHHSVIIEVRDSGCGIPPEFRERVFDSFLSGRPGGTGLGLSIAKRIMRAHHGDIEVASTGPEGTVMRISLPLAQ